MANQVRLRILRNLAAPLPRFREGEMVTVDAGVAEQLLAGLFGEVIDFPAEIPDAPRESKPPKKPKELPA